MQAVSRSSLGTMSQQSSKSHALRLYLMSSLTRALSTTPETTPLLEGGIAVSDSLRRDKITVPRPQCTYAISISCFRDCLDVTR